MLKTESSWDIDYNGWKIPVIANGYPQAKYRAWKSFKEKFGSISFRDFLVSARQW